MNSTTICRSRRVVRRYGPGTPNGESINDVYRTSTRKSTDVRSGQRNPGWRDRIRRVTQAGSAYSRSATTLGFVTGRISGSLFENAAKTIRREETLFGQLFLDSGPVTPTPFNFGYLDADAKVKFLQKARSTQRLFQGGVFLGELRETLNMIARPGAALRRGIGAYLAEAKKVARRSHFTDRGRILTKTWLEYSYGWRPLFAEIDAGMEALATVNHIVPDIIAGVAADEVRGEPYARTTLASGVQVVGKARFRAEHRGSVRYLGCVAWESENRAKDWESPKWGLTLSDFIPTVWNLIPYSFIVDYFSNVGSVLDASSFGRVNLRWGVKSVRSNSSVKMSQAEASLQLNAGNTPISATAICTLGQLSVWSFNRSLIDHVTVGLNDLHFKVPGVGDWRKWANLSALAIDRLY
jgi:hypothetical protein